MPPTPAEVEPLAGVASAAEQSQGRYRRSIPKLQMFFGMRTGIKPELRRICGSGDEAIILNQIICYWWARDRDGLIRARLMRCGHRWMSKSYREWAVEHGMTEKQARRAIKALVDRGFLERRYFLFNGRQTTHVRPLTVNIAEAANCPHDQEPYRRPREPHINWENLEIDGAPVISELLDANARRDIVERFRRAQSRPRGRRR